VGEVSSSLATKMFAENLLLATGVSGLFGRSETYESVARGVSALISDRFSVLSPERVHFPPLLARETFDQTNYLESFPDLMGSVHVFTGDERRHRELLDRREREEPWQELLEPSEVVVASAACHAVYPLCSGILPAKGRTIEIDGYCFRHEPSDDLARMMSFRMHEIVRIGDADQALGHRDDGLAIGEELLVSLGLAPRFESANDPFFGRAGKMLAIGQRDDNLKIEGLVFIEGGAPTAVMSGNCHQEHFSRPFGIRVRGGSLAQSSCVAFGIDRIVLALFAKHGAQVSSWPATVTELLLHAS
jgi:seryl-tRNA synthetase